MSRARKLHKTNIHSKIKNQKKPIKSIMVIGDSMSDRGVVYTGKRPGLRILQMYGLEKSPQNRFTNGYVWVDHLAAHIANKHITKDLMKNGLDHELKQDMDKDDLSDRTITHHKYRKLRLKPEDIADGIINNDKRIKKSVDRYDLKDPTLEKSKLKQDYVTSSEYKKFDKIGDAQPAPGYLFWDQVHPTTHVHSIIARKIEKIIRSKYDLRIPKSLPKHSPVAELKFLELKDFFFKKKPKDNKESISQSVKNASRLKVNK